jgi:hypothetical protein
MIEDENVFLVGGFLDTEVDFRGAIGVYDYFWVLDPVTRTRLIDSWLKTITHLREEHIELTTALQPDDEYGSMAIFSDENAIQVRSPKDNVVQFPKK